MKALTSLTLILSLTACGGGIKRGDLAMANGNFEAAYMEYYAVASSRSTAKTRARLEGARAEILNGFSARTAEFRLNRRFDQVALALHEAERFSPPRSWLQAEYDALYSAWAADLRSQRGIAQREGRLGDAMVFSIVADTMEPDPTGHRATTAAFLDNVFPNLNASFRGQAGREVQAGFIQAWRAGAFGDRGVRDGGSNLIRLEANSMTSTCNVSRSGTRMAKHRYRDGTMVRNPEKDRLRAALRAAEDALSAIDRELGVVGRDLALLNTRATAQKSVVERSSRRARSLTRELQNVDAELRQATADLQSSLEAETRFRELEATSVRLQGERSNLLRERRVILQREAPAAEAEVKRTEAAFKRTNVTLEQTRENYQSWQRASAETRAKIAPIDARIAQLNAELGDAALSTTTATPSLPAITATELKALETAVSDAKAKLDAIIAERAILRNERNTLRSRMSDDEDGNGAEMERIAAIQKLLVPLRRSQVDAKAAYDAALEALEAGRERPLALDQTLATTPAAAPSATESPEAKRAELEQLKKERGALASELARQNRSEATARALWVKARNAHRASRTARDAAIERYENLDNRAGEIEMRLSRIRSKLYTVTQDMRAAAPSIELLNTRRRAVGALQARRSQLGPQTKQANDVAARDLQVLRQIEADLASFANASSDAMNRRQVAAQNTSRLQDQVSSTPDRVELEKEASYAVEQWTRTCTISVGWTMSMRGMSPVSDRISLEQVHQDEVVRANSRIRLAADPLTWPSADAAELQRLNGEAGVALSGKVRSQFPALAATVRQSARGDRNQQATAMVFSHWLANTGELETFIDVNYPELKSRPR